MTRYYNIWRMHYCNWFPNKSDSDPCAVRKNRTDPAFISDLSVYIIMHLKMTSNFCVEQEHVWLNLVLGCLSGSLYEHSLAWANNLNLLFYTLGSQTRVWASLPVSVSRPRCFLKHFILCSWLPFCTPAISYRPEEVE